MSQIPKESMILSFILGFFFFLPITHSFNEGNVAKVVCSLARFNEVDILKRSYGDSVKLSKSLQKECDIKSRFVVSTAFEIGRKDIVSFASHKMENMKETLSPFQHYFVIFSYFFTLLCVFCAWSLIHCVLAMLN